MIHNFGGINDISDRNIPETLGDRLENPGYQVFNKESQDIITVQRITREMIYSSGAWVNIHGRTHNSDVDEVFDVDPNVTYWNPVRLKAYFDPQPLQFELTKWGMEPTGGNKTEIYFHRLDVLDKNKRMVRIGDLIEIPYDGIGDQKPKYYEIQNAEEHGNYRYVWLYVKCSCTLLNGDVNVRPAHDQLHSTFQQTKLNGSE